MVCEMSDEGTVPAPFSPSLFSFTIFPFQANIDGTWRLSIAWLQMAKLGAKA